MVLEITGPPILVVMGVAGTGKSTVAGLLAERLNWELQEGDDLHPPANVAKMSAGIPLDDQDRWPWLDAIAAWIASKRERGEPGVVTCSALKRSYRDRLRGPNVIFVFINGPRAVIEARMASRKDHYMPPALLDSQLATLEPPTSDENVLQVNLSAEPQEEVAEVLRSLPGPHRLLGTAALGCDLDAYGRHDFLGEKCKLVIALAPEQERVEAVTDCEVGELVDPLVDWTAQQAEAGSVGDLAIDVQDPSDVCRLAASSSRGVINASRALTQEGRLATKGRHPPIRKPSGKTQRARAVHAEPDTDGMHRYRPRLRTGETVMRAIEAQIALATPDQPNDLDRLLEGGKRVARLTSRPAVRLNRIPEAAGTEGKLEPPTAEHVEAGCRLSQHRWRA